MAVRINLLPREILERRKWEKFYPLVLIVGVALIGVIVLIGLVLMLRVASMNSELQQAQELSQQKKKQAEAFKVFEDKEAALQGRRAIAGVAVAGTVNWARLGTEVSLVLPSEVFLSSFQGEQITEGGPYDLTGALRPMPATLTLLGFTPDTKANSMSEGYKSLAKTLVRLNDLSSLSSVWLQEAAIAPYPTVVSQGFESSDALQFTTTSNVSVTASLPSSSTADSAPPTAADQ